jgi:LysM repeat protein
MNFVGSPGGEENMSKKFGLIVLVLLALTLTLSACSMSASTPPPATPKKNRPQASPTSDVVDPMVQLQIVASQTAAALAGIPFDPNATAAPAVDVPATAIPPVDPGLPTPTGNAPVPQPPVQTVRPETYTLQQGEFIFCLARRFDVDVDQTLALNGLVDSETLQPGLTVKIPASGSFAGVRARTPHPATYTVQSSNETIYSIACLYGDVDPLNIAAVNGLAAPYTLTVGAQLQIP